MKRFILFRFIASKRNFSGAFTCFVNVQLHSRRHRRSTSKLCKYTHSTEISLQTIQFSLSQVILSGCHISPLIFGCHYFVCIENEISKFHNKTLIRKSNYRINLRYEQMFRTGGRGNGIFVESALKY